MFCALLTSRYQVSVYRTNGPLVYCAFSYFFKYWHSVTFKTHCDQFNVYVHQAKTQINSGNRPLAVPKMGTI